MNITLTLYGRHFNTDLKFFDRKKVLPIEVDRRYTTIVNGRIASAASHPFHV